jgi:hypothetical protein
VPLPSIHHLPSFERWDSRRALPDWAAPATDVGLETLAPRQTPAPHHHGRSRKSDVSVQ